MDNSIHPIRQFIRSIHSYIKDVIARNRLKRLVLTEKCLEPGAYRMIHSRRYYLIKSDIPDSLLSSLGVKGNQAKLKGIVLRESSETAKGQAMMVTACGYKVFNIRNNVVYKKLASEQEANSLKKAIELLSPCFKNTYIGIRDGFSEEKIVYGKPRNEWQQTEVSSVYMSILDTYNKYYKSGIETQSAPYDLTDIIKLLNPKYEIYKIFHNLLIETDGLCYPYIYTHGDMHLGNIIYDGQIWYIDFECARKEIFFYDIFNVLYVDFVDCHDSLLLDLYFKGNDQIIEYFKRAFAFYGLYFDMNERKLYFKAYLQARIRFNVLDLYNNYKGTSFENCIIKVSAKYRSVLDYINSL